MILFWRRRLTIPVPSAAHCSDMESRRGEATVGTARRMLSLVMVSVCAVLAFPIAARAEWPERPVKLIVTFPPGSANDAAARIFADALGKKWGKPVVVDVAPSLRRVDVDAAGGVTVELSTRPRAARPEEYPSAASNAATGNHASDEVQVPSGSYAVEGIGGNCVPDVADFSRIRAAYSISDAESFLMARDLLKRTGIFAGPSSGTLLGAALRYCVEQTSPKRVVTFVCDTGSKYLSKMYNDYWMLDQGYLERPATGTLRELIARRYEEGAVITVAPDDTLLTAFQRMRVADISQVPVVEKGRCVGVLDESDLLVAVHGDPSKFHSPVREAMTSRLETISCEAGIESVYDILDRGLVALVTDGDLFLGLVTRSDLLSHLRRKLH